MTGEHWVLPAELRELADSGEKGIVEEVLTVFQSDTAERIAAMRAAGNRGERDELRKQGHALKGSSGQVGATALAVLCRSLEMTAATAGEPELAEIVERIDREFQQVARQMQAAG